MKNDIIFEDGLSRYNIENNINNQGKYKWLFDVECSKLIVGLLGNALHIKSGLWINGILDMTHSVIFDAKG